MSVRAKFSVWGKEEVKQANGDSSTFNITLMPVTTGSAENEEFWRWTPAGQLQLSTINEAAAAQLNQGKEYYIDITPAN